MRAKVEVPATTPVGLYLVRVATKQGVSNARPFCVDDLPVTAPPAAPPRSKATSSNLPTPGSVSGRIDPETSEFHRISVKAGQRLTIEVLARRIGSSLDPIILMHDAKTGREIPSLYSDDAPGLQSDARLTHTFKEAGDYLVEVRDSTHRGGADYWYRLRVGDFPSVIATMPLAIRLGKPTPVGFAGPDIDGVAAQPVTAGSANHQSSLFVVPKGNRTASGWPVTARLSDMDEIVEQEPNNSPDKANRVPVPCGISAGFQTKSDVDCFRFAGKKGQKYVIEAQTQELLSPADVFFTLKDSKGAEVARIDPQKASRIDFTAPADGEFVVSVEHLNYLHGPNEVYRLTITQPSPGFDVVLGSDRVEVPMGGVGLLPIQAITRRDYGGPIELIIDGVPGITGSVIVTAAAPPAPSLPLAIIPVIAKPDLAPGIHEIRVKAKAIINGKETIAFADLGDRIKQTMGGLPFPPRVWEKSVAVAVTHPPFRVTVKLPRSDATAGVPLPLTVAATRDAGFAEEITLALAGAPPTITIAAKPIAKGAAETTFPLNLAAKSPLGTFNVAMIGKAKFQGRDFAVAALVPITIVGPFDLQASAPAPVKPGDRVKIKVTATRKGGYAGPIDLQLRNLPAGVTAGPAQIPADKTVVEIELTVAATAVAVDKADVNVLGTAPGAAGQQAASGNFAIKIGKK